MGIAPFHRQFSGIHQPDARRLVDQLRGDGNTLHHPTYGAVAAGAVDLARHWQPVAALLIWQVFDINETFQLAVFHQLCLLVAVDHVAEQVIEGRFVRPPGVIQVLVRIIQEDGVSWSA
jgi:hypothetical protein